MKQINICLHSVFNTILQMVIRKIHPLSIVNCQLSI